MNSSRTGFSSALAALIVTLALPTHSCTSESGDPGVGGDTSTDVAPPPEDARQDSVSDILSETGGEVDGSGIPDAADDSDGDQFVVDPGIVPVPATVCELVDASCGNASVMRYDGMTMSTGPVTSYEFSNAALGTDVVFSVACGSADGVAIACPDFRFDSADDWFVVWLSGDAGPILVAAYADSATGPIDSFGHDVLLEDVASVMAAFESLAGHAPPDCGLDAFGRAPGDWCPPDANASVIEPQ